MFESLGTFLKEKISPENKPQSGCHACGQCCEEFGGFLRASQADLERWEKLGRKDLLAHAGETGWLWLDLETGERLEGCPYLQRDSEGKGLCGIHEIKPDICRAYPSEATGRRCVCGVHFPVSLWTKNLTDLH
jgi:Fe-S-cluster containining protein